MQHSLEAATDAASILLFDPQSLPEEFDVAASKGDPTELLERLHDEGRLFWINTDGDGCYLLHVFIDEVVPESLRQFLRDPLTSDAFRVTSGEVFFTGTEYGYRDADSALRRYPHMGGSFFVENGVYEVSLYRTEYVDGLHEQAFRQHVTASERRSHVVFNTLIYKRLFPFRSAGEIWKLVKKQFPSMVATLQRHV